MINFIQIVPTHIGVYMPIQDHFATVDITSTLRILTADLAAQGRNLFSVRHQLTLVAIVALMVNILGQVLALVVLATTSLLAVLVTIWMRVAALAISAARGLMPPLLPNIKVAIVAVRIHTPPTMEALTAQIVPPTATVIMERAPAPAIMDIQAREVEAHCTAYQQTLLPPHRL